MAVFFYWIVNFWEPKHGNVGGRIGIATVSALPSFARLPFRVAYTVVMFVSNFQMYKKTTALANWCIS